MKRPEDPAVAEELAITAIGKQIEADEPDSEHPMTAQRIADIYKGLEAARSSIERLNNAIMNAGEMGTGSSVGEATLRAASSPAR